MFTELSYRTCSHAILLTFCPLRLTLEISGGGLPRNRAELAGLLTDPVAQRMPNTSVSSEFMPGQSPILSPKMRQFMENMNRRNERGRRQTGLLDRYAGQTGGAAGLLGVIGSQ